MRKRKQNKKYKFKDRIRNIRNKVVNYGINTIFFLLLAIPVVLYFDKPLWCAVDIFIILHVLFVMSGIEFIYMIFNYKEYMDDERLINAIDKAYR